MPDPTVIKFSLPVTEFDIALLAVGARQPGTAAFQDAVAAYLRGEFECFGGSTLVRVENEIIELSWTTDQDPAGALPSIIDKLKRGHYREAITLLRLFSSGLPDDANILYNLGMALSDSGKLNEAVSHLRRTVTIAPDFTNARVALGIALERQGDNEHAMRILTETAARDAQNAWAQRSLGASLLNADRISEAEEHLRHAAVLDPTDQLAMFGLAEALAKLRRLPEAEEAYRKCVDIDAQSQIAAVARQERRKIASR